MKEILYGTNDKEPHTETVAQLAQELYNSGLLISLVENLQVIDFEVIYYIPQAIVFECDFIKSWEMGEVSHQRFIYYFSVMVPSLQLMMVLLLH